MPNRAKAPSGGPAVIAIDWGTSSFRVALADENGHTLARNKHPDGILTAAGRFAEVLRAAVAPLYDEHGRLPILMCGMIGSRQGWHEAPYVHTPAHLSDLAASLLTFEAPGVGPVSIVPGVDTRRPQGPPDVIRGEETQILGALDVLGIDSATFVHPGIHAKWIRVEQRAIVDFKTYMTGEVYGALKDHTILGRMMDAAAQSEVGFRRGIDASAAADAGPGALLHLIFSARTLGLFGELGPDQAASYLSGLLIGAEMRDALRNVEGEIVIVGSQDLEQRYRLAASHLGVPSRTAPHDTAVPGLTAVARQAGLIGSQGP